MEDLSAAFKKEIHENCINAYRNSAVYPILQVMKAGEFLEKAGVFRMRKKKLPDIYIRQYTAFEKKHPL